MARERYLIGKDNGSNYSKPIVLTTKKEKWNNWWYYHSKLVLVGVIALILAIYVICSIVFKEKPDYTVALMGDTYISTNTRDSLTELLESYGTDINGDGKVLVQLNSYYFGSSGDGTDYETQMAAITRFAGDLSGGDSVIWITDEYGYTQFEEDADLILEDVSKNPNANIIFFDQVKAFEELNIISEYETWTDDEYKDGTIGKYFICIRDFDGFTEKLQNKLSNYIDENKILFDNLVNGTKPE